MLISQKKSKTMKLAYTIFCSTALFIFLGPLGPLVLAMYEIEIATELYLNSLLVLGWGEYFGYMPAKIAAVVH